MTVQRIRNLGYAGAPLVVQNADGTTDEIHVQPRATVKLASGQRVTADSLARNPTCSIVDGPGAVSNPTLPTPVPAFKSSKVTSDSKEG